MSGRITREDIVEDMREAASAVEGPMTAAEYNRHGEYSSATAGDRFGSWNEAKEAAGLEVAQERSASGVRLRCPGCDELYLWDKVYEGRGVCPHCGTATSIEDGRLSALASVENLRRLAEGPAPASEISRSDLPFDVRESAHTISVTSSAVSGSRTGGARAVTYLAGDLRRAADLFIELNRDFVEDQMSGPGNSLKQLMDDDVYSILLEQWHWGHNRMDREVTGIFE